MKKSIFKLEKISNTLYNHQTYYEFNDKDVNLSKKYRKGRVNAAKWLNDLILYYIQKESNFIFEFKEQIQNQKKELNSIKDKDFKAGIYDELNIIEEMLNDRNN
eukprot:TRINITY_DN129185_c0_g1_i6.p1 TRINITY_DN129185_c0_g1~~TRINITY_DN129185_c0_g1_i6.p1  ORF type:complete len:104 (-),score=9.00 TRINITY_DN129185_c0_g1_i6:387-698(-)